MHQYAGQFEVHLTVQASDSSTSAFRQWCEQHQFKCVRIVLARGKHCEQPMATWRRNRTILPAVLAEAKDFAEQAVRAGHDVVRLKVETPLTNGDVPLSDDEARGRDPNLYFEHHLKLRRAVLQPMEKLRAVCESHRAHLSRNAFARVDPEFEDRFVTLRSYRVGASTSIREVETLLASLAGIHECVIEQESEYCVYDSNLDLDDGWLPESAAFNLGCKK